MICKNTIRQAVILAAGERKDFDKPSTFLQIENETVIERLIMILKDNGIDKIVIVTGYENHFFDNLNIREVELVYSDRFKRTGTMYSLSLAEKYIDEDFLLIEGDLIFEEKTIGYLLDSKEKNSLVLTNESGSGDESLVEIRNGSVFRISKDIHQLSTIDGEFIGLSRLSIETYRDMLVDFKASKNPYLYYEYVLMNIKDKHNISYTKIDDLVWTELDTNEDYENLKSSVYPKLKKREVEFRENYTRTLFSQLMGDKYHITEKVEKLGGMNNNNNYKIYTDRGDFVFRLPGKGSNESVNRESELYNAKVAHEIGIDCNTIYFDKESGLKVTEYIDNAETLSVVTARREDNMELMAETLKLLHNNYKKFYRDFKPFIEMQEYKETVIKQKASLLENYKELDYVLNSLIEELELLEIEYVPCHLDAWPENFVKGSDKTYLIDWEYSANYDRLWDVVSISLECEYSKDEEEVFFSKYFNGKPMTKDIEKMDLLKVLMDIYWSMWSLAKVSCGETDGEIYKYSYERFNREIENFNKIIK